MYRAVIFDMNGVIISDEHIHHQAWLMFCKRHRINLTEDEYKHYVSGRTEKDVLNYMFNKELSDAEIEQYVAERTQIVTALYDDGINLTSGLLEFLKDLKKHHIPAAVATSARMPATNFVLDTFQIRSYFDQITTAEEISHGKPDPEIYLVAASKIDVDPTECIAFEDTVSGIKSAQAAGMYVVALTTTHRREDLATADRIVGSFVELSVENLGLKSKKGVMNE